MFKRKPNTPTSPTALSFTDILSDLTRLQSYHQTHTGEKIDVLEIIKTEDSADDKIPTQNSMTKMLSPKFLDSLINVNDASSEVISNTYEMIISFIKVNQRLIKSQNDLDGLESEIEILRNELSGTIDTLNNSNIVIGEGETEGIIEKSFEIEEEKV